MAKLKINLVGDTAEQEVSVKFTPKLKETFNSNALSTLISGFTLALQEILEPIPLLRPATPEEIEAKTYIFQNEQTDNALYNARKNLRNRIEQEFVTIMHNMFPDVEYIEQTILYHQEQSMTRTEEETKEIIAEIEKIKERLVNTLGKEKEKEKEGVVQCAQDPT
jgi:hypothetical protein